MCNKKSIFTKKRIFDILREGIKKRLYALINKAFNLMRRRRENDLPILKYIFKRIYKVHFGKKISFFHFLFDF